MSIRSLLLVVCVIASWTMVDHSFGQRARVRLNQDFRYLGAFQSAGYHWRTPGPCVGYYNPYSHLNSSLRSGGYPQGAHAYMSRYGAGYHSELNSFDIPTVVGVDNALAPAAGNSVPSVIDNSEDVSDQEMSELEKEVQSIMNEGNTDQSPKSDAKPKVESNDNDATSLWPGFNDYGKNSFQKRSYQKTKRPTQSARRASPYRTW